MVESDEAPDPLSPVTNEQAKGNNKTAGSLQRAAGST